MGIVIGLLHFDTTNIDKSIPLLLEGLKTAFITSIVGMGAAMTFNFLDAWKFAPKRASNGVTLDVTPRDIFQSMEEQKEILKAMVTGLSGQEEGSLVGQLKFLRQDVSTHKDWMKHSFAAVGFSSGRPVVNESGIEDPNRSRRVTFKVMTNAELQIRRIIQE